MENLNNMENNNMEHLELEQMRGQMNDLRKQLDSQQIVNEQVLQRSMKRQFSWIKRYIYFEIALVPICLLIFAGLHYMLGLSWWLFGFLAVMLIADVTVDYCINRVDFGDLLSKNLLEASEKFARMKRWRLWSFVISMLMVILWLVGLLYEISHATTHSDFMAGFAQGGFWGAIIGAIIGIVVALVIFFKMQRTNDDIIAQINELRQTSPETISKI